MDSQSQCSQNELGRPNHKNGHAGTNAHIATGQRVRAAGHGDALHVLAVRMGMIVIEMGHRGVTNRMLGSM
jgi:uncharacterized protein (DUF2345 family)